ncbi:MAG: hypothetical protein ACXVA9_05275 [Bdellovibrionales bacterium]
MTLNRWPCALMIVLLFAAPSLFICEPANCRISGDTFYDGKTGFAISKPADWEFVKIQKNSGIQLKNNQVTPVEDGLLVSFTKNMGDKFTGVPPTAGVKILNNVKAGSDLVQWVEGELHRQATHDKYFFPGSAAISTPIDGKSGARASYVNSTIFKGNEVRVYHILYVVPVGRKVYLIHMNCNEELENKFVGVFSEIAGSILVNAE